MISHETTAGNIPEGGVYRPVIIFLGMASRAVELTGKGRGS
jgi:hypothetical protein